MHILKEIHIQPCPCILEFWRLTVLDTLFNHSIYMCRYKLHILKFINKVLAILLVIIIPSSVPLDQQFTADLLFSVFLISSAVLLSQKTTSSITVG